MVRLVNINLPLKLPVFLRIRKALSGSTLWAYNLYHEPAYFHHPRMRSSLPPRIAAPTRRFPTILGITFEGYQRLRQTPPPLGRSVFGRASLTFNVVAVEGGNRFDGFSVVTHVNEPKPFGLSRVTVSHNADSLNCSVCFKERIENRFRDGNTQVSNKYAFHMLQVFPVVVNAHPSHAAITSLERRSYAAAAAAVSITFRDIVGTQYWRCQCSQAKLRMRVTSVRSRGFARTS